MSLEYLEVQRKLAEQGLEIDPDGVGNKVIRIINPNGKPLPPSYVQISGFGVPKDVLKTENNVIKESPSIYYKCTVIAMEELDEYFILATLKCDDKTIFGNKEVSLLMAQWLELTSEQRKGKSPVYIGECRNMHFLYKFAGLEKV